MSYVEIEESTKAASTKSTLPFIERKMRERYQNAATTACNALGHGKGMANERLAKEYADTLRSMGAEVPDFYEAAELGEFNGPGAV